METQNQINEWYVLDDDGICTQQESCNGSPDKTKDASDKGNCECSEIREVKEDIYHSRMLSPFNMLLLSNDEKSQDMYEKNTNMEFTCNLNQRQDFTSNWSVILKSLQLSSHLYNIQNSQYYFKYVVVTLPPNSNEEGNLKYVWMLSIIEINHRVAR